MFNNERENEWATQKMFLMWKMAEDMYLLNADNLFYLIVRVYFLNGKWTKLR